MKPLFDMCDTIRGYAINERFLSKPFETMTPREAKLSFVEFLQTKGERLEILLATINAESPPVAGTLDFTPESLVPLGRWLSNHVHVRKLTIEELRVEREQFGQTRVVQKHPALKEYFHRLMSDWKLTEETLSLCWDIGIYFGEVFTKRYDTVQWTYFTSPKTVDVNRPVLSGWLDHP